MESNERRWGIERQTPAESISSVVPIGADIDALLSEIYQIYEELNNQAETGRASGDIGRTALKTSREEDATVQISSNETAIAQEVLLPLDQLRLMGRNIIALRKQYTRDVR